MAKDNHVVTQVMALAERVGQELECEIVDVEYQKEGSEWILRIYIDREDLGVDHELCQAFSRKIDVLLDEEDPIASEYLLEISSPGIERPLKKPEHFNKFVGETVNIKRYAAYEGKKQWQGTLLGFKDNQVGVDVKGKALWIDADSITKAHLVAEF